MIDKLELTFPLWSLHLPLLLGQGDDRRSFITLRRVVSGEEFWPIFTDLIQAEQLIAITEKDDHRPLRLPNFEDIYEVGNYWVERGVKFVGLNVAVVPLENGQFQDTTTLVGISDFLAEVRKWEQRGPVFSAPEEV